MRVLRCRLIASPEGRGTSAVFFLLLVSCVALSLLTLPEAVSAENPKEQYRRIQKEMQSHKDKLEQAKRRERSVLEDLESVTKRLEETEADLRKQRRRLGRTESEIGRVEKEIALTRGELDKRKRWMKVRLRAMQRYGQSGEMVQLLAGADDMAEFMRRWRYLEIISLAERKVMEEYARNLGKLDDKEKQLKSLTAELKKGAERIRLTEAAMAEKRREKETLLASVRREKSSHEKLVRELKEASKRLLEVIRKLDEKDTYVGKGFPELRGGLTWPVNGSVAVPYGSQRDPKFNTPVFRNGIYIKTGDSAVKAVYGGKVVFADWFKGYGNLVIVNHGEGYHTLYGNLSETFLKVGDIIKAKDVIGKVGESGILNAPSLYFEVRYKGKPLDPMQWLKRK
ncbi:MAG: peptidoglycan DD-metalloendopeptidase family protein [Nitrospirae bacterium]|nr:peptidoglycan DD-metalloendopeptidase family protein [Nitrospirota bacterium]